MMHAKHRLRLPLLALTAALLCAADAAEAQTIGRLFNTPAERSQLDGARNAPPATVANAVAGPAGMAPAGANQQQPYPGAAQPVPYPDASQPAPYPGADGSAMPGLPPGLSAGVTPGANPSEPAPPPPPEVLVMNGVLRNSSGRSTVWLNDIAQSGQQLKVTQRQRSAPQLTVQLPSGKKVLLKPGQRYDLADGRVKDVNEP